MRLELGVAGAFEGVHVGAVRQHRVMQRDPARHEAAAGLGVVDAVDQPHELAHDVHVVPGRTEGVLGHHPAIGKDHEVNVGGAWRLGRRGQHGEDRRVGVVEQNRADRREAAEVVLVGRVVAVPGDHVERRVGDLRHPQRTAPLHGQLRGCVAILVGRDRGQEVARVGQAVGADRPALGQGQGTAIVLAQITPDRTVRQLGAELDAARDHRDLAGLDVDDAELGAQPQAPLLGHEHHLAVGVVEVLVLHRAGGEINVRRHAGLAAGIAGCGNGPDTLDQRQAFGRERDRVPAHGCWRDLDLGAGSRAP